MPEKRQNEKRWCCTNNWMKLNILMKTYHESLYKQKEVTLKLSVTS